MCQESKTLINSESLTPPDSSENVSSLFISDDLTGTKESRYLATFDNHREHRAAHMCTGKVVKHATRYFVWLVEERSNSTVIGLIAAETPQSFGQDQQDRLH